MKKALLLILTVCIVSIFGNVFIEIFSELENDLHRHVFGQPLVINTIVNALRSHWDPKHKPQKALTLSFHGWPGSGKNYVSKYITDNLYVAGSKSKFVHNFIGRIQFPRNDKIQEYQVCFI